MHESLGSALLVGWGAGVAAPWPMPVAALLAAARNGGEETNRTAGLVCAGIGVGCIVVVVSGLANNLLPLCEPGVSVRSLVNCGLIVCGIFVAVLIISIASAYLYGRVFVGP